MIDNEDLLARVEKPGRYAGGELNAIIKDQAGVKVSFALAFPDVYEVGMSYTGFKILYNILNGLPFVQAERVYAPWVDMEKLLRAKGRRLAALETGRELSEFDLVGFTLQYELTYSNIVNMLDLGKVAVMATARGEKEPFVAGGGPCVFNPEPLADFFDFFIIGDGEELIAETAAACRDWKEAGRPGGRRGFLETLARLPGIYVPGFYQAEYTDGGRFKQLTALNQAAPPHINKRAVASLDAADYPTAPVVPFNEIIHDRIVLEVFRGCTRGCRFCHAGMVYRPLRERSVAVLKQLARRLVDSTGYNEISLISLSTADYSCLAPLLADLTRDFAHERVSVSLPSLRLDSFSVEVAQKVSGIRKSGLTFAPEAGTQRLRDVINKGVSEENVLAATSAA
ncbi:MAG: TIGR03960 family B12-binding radical SAM protein, partial [Acidaminococcales bacterium]|nr:TIGR03960 family B12-binding radical SAM protein [Acidaminococcales bacterium]